MTDEEFPVTPVEKAKAHLLYAFLSYERKQPRTHGHNEARGHLVTKIEEFIAAIVEDKLKDHLFDHHPALIDK